MQKVKISLQESASVLSAMALDQSLHNMAVEIADICVDAFNNGNKVLFMGNGGSAADSQHLAAELVSRFAFDRPALPAFALTVDTSVLTSIGNDYGFEKLFARQVEAIANRGDVLFGFSTSGRSPNIITAFEVARKMNVITIGMAGNQKARITEVVDYCIEIPSSSTPNIQEGHIVIGHIICGLIEEKLFKSIR